MAKAKNNIKILHIYDNGENGFAKYLVILSNDEIWSIGKSPMNIAMYLGKIGKDYKDEKSLHNKGKNITDKKIPKEINQWLSEYIRYMES